MPRDMTMQQPSAGIVALECNRKPSASGQQSNISARRIVIVEGKRIGCFVVSRVAAAEDHEVMPVHVDWVRESDEDGIAFVGDVGNVCAGDDDVLPFIDAVEFVDVVVWIEGPVIDGDKSWVGEVEPISYVSIVCN